jgi:hypothetical protein
MQMIRPSHDILQMNIATQNRACEPQTLCMEPGIHALLPTCCGINVRAYERGLPSRQSAKYISGGASLCTSHGSVSVPRARLDAGMNGPSDGRTCGYDVASVVLRTAVRIHSDR